MTRTPTSPAAAAGLCLATMTALGGCATAPAVVDLDWMLGSWRGVRRAGGDGPPVPMTVRVEPLPGGDDQLEVLRVDQDGTGAPYVGFAVRRRDPAGRWWMTYANSPQRRFAQLHGTVTGDIATWESLTPGRTRESRLVSERLGAGRWRKTQYASTDGGATWTVVFSDELERDAAGR